MIFIIVYIAVGAVEGVYSGWLSIRQSLPAPTAMVAVVLWVREMISVIPIIEFTVLVVLGVTTYVVSVLLMDSE